MPDRPLLRSLLTGNVMLRLAAVVLAALILGHALFSGPSGWWAIAIVMASATALRAILWLAARLRTALTPPTPDRPAGTAGRATAPDPAPPAGPAPPTESAEPAAAPGGAKSAAPGHWRRAARVAAVLAPRAQMIAMFALLLLIVHAAITGYVGLWTILAALALAILALLLVERTQLRNLALIAGTAAILAATVVFVGGIFQGSGETRTLAVSVAAIVLPVVISDQLFNVLKQPTLTAPHHVAIIVLTLLLGLLGWFRADYLPGVTNHCYTLPTSTGVTVLRVTTDGDRCYGLLDTADPGVLAAPAFGLDPATTKLERLILAANRPIENGDLTVVWLGALSCDPLPADRTRCADGRDYPAERDQLRALYYAQSHIAAGGDHRLHVVIADATQDVAHANDIASLIIDRRSALGDRLVVIGGGDSRDVTQQAINRLLDAGVPVVAPNLLADLGAPGHPFVDRPGYLQLAPSNLDYATDAVERLTKAYPKGFRLDVFQKPDPTDQYTNSLVNDLLAAVGDAPGATARHLPTLGLIDGTICLANTTKPPAVLYFADRWTNFAPFVQRVDEVCGHSRPRLVIADVSVSRFMANYQLRAVSNADWAVDYNVGGPSCADLTTAAFSTLAGQVQQHGDLVGLGEGETFACADRAATAMSTGAVRNACPLDAAVKLTSQPCQANDLGTYLIPEWDAVLLADALLPARPPAGRDYLSSLNLRDFVLSTGTTATVEGGVLTGPTIAVRQWHGRPLDDPRVIWERPSPALALPDDPEPGRAGPQRS